MLVTSLQKQYYVTTFDNYILFVLRRYYFFEEMSYLSIEN